jgi:beta-lactamase class A
MRLFRTLLSHNSNPNHAVAHSACTNSIALKSSRVNLALLILLVAVLPACRSSASTSATPNQLAGPQCNSDQLQQQITTIGRSIDGTVGATVELFESGQRVGVKTENHFPMQSVYKLPIAMAVLQQVEKGSLKFDQKVQVKPSDFVSAGQRSPLRDANPRGVETTVNGLLSFMVSESDGTASDVLLDLLGGPDKVNSYLRELGISDLNVVTSEKVMGRDQQAQYRNWATPSALLKLLELLHKGEGISPTNREILLSLMSKSPTGPQRIKGMLPPGVDVAHKTGSSGTINGLTRATNDVGIITLSPQRHVGVVVLISDSRADEASRDKVIARIAHAAYDCWFTAPTR